LNESAEAMKRENRRSQTRSGINQCAIWRVLSTDALAATPFGRYRRDMDKSRFHSGSPESVDAMHVSVERKISGSVKGIKQNSR
jgi:hypothetical protein